MQWFMMLLLAHLAYRAILSSCHTNVSSVRRPSTLENKYSNFYKTPGSSVLKFHMEHDLTPMSQIVKLGQVKYPRWPPLLKIAKVTKSTSPNHWIFLAKFWHGISIEHRYSEL